MNELTLALCKKQGIGVAAWLLSLCVTNQAFKDVKLDAGAAQTTINREIKIPMDERYFLLLVDDKTGAQSVSTLVCQRVSNDKKENVPGMSDIETPNITATVDILSYDDGKLIGHYDLSPDCPVAAHNNGIIGFGGIDIKRGRYRVEVKFVNANPLTEGNSASVEVLLRGSGVTRS